MMNGFCFNNANQAGLILRQKGLIMKYAVYLIEECTGNEYEKYFGNYYLDCEVYIDHHKYSCPKGCYYKIYAVGK